MTKKKSLIIYITSIVLTVIVAGGAIWAAIYINGLKDPFDYPEITYKNFTTRYFDGSIPMQETKLLNNSTEQFTQHYNYFDINEQTDYSTDITLTLNSFYNIAISVLDGKINIGTNTTEVSNGFKLKVYLSAPDKYQHASEFYGVVRQSIEAGNVFFEFKAEGAQSFTPIYNLRDLYVYDTSDPNYVDYFDDLRFVNGITTANQRYILIENTASDDNLFHNVGNYRLRVNHRSRFVSEEFMHSEYFDEKVTFCSFKKVKSEIENIFLPESHTLNELFYTLKFTDLTDDNAFIVSDSINIPKISVSSKLFLDANPFVTRTHETERYSIFLVDPASVQFEIAYQKTFGHDIKSIYSLTNFINEHETLSLKDKESNRNYYQPKEQSIELTSLVAFNNPGIYCIKLTYKVQSVICSTLQPMGQVIECEDIYYFQIL
jgi:hypothetical protein